MVNLKVVAFILGILLVITAAFMALGSSGPLAALPVLFLQPFNIRLDGDQIRNNFV